MFRLLTVLLCMGILSCRKPTPTTSTTEPPTHPTPETPASHTTLANAQLQLAQAHLASGSPEKALPYLAASLESNPSETTENLLTHTLESHRFTVPTYRLEHPAPITRFLETPGSVFVALAGKYPTLIRWKTTSTPAPSAILFPAETEEISHLSSSPNHQYLLIHRGETNLLCTAADLNPITNLGTFPVDLAPSHLQPFSHNSLLLAHPTRSEHHLIWHIRDTATGEILRSEATPIYPYPTTATFQDTTLIVTHNDHTQLHIPIYGQLTREKSSPTPHSKPTSTPVSTTYSIAGNSLIHHQPIPPSPDSNPDLTALSGYSLDPETQILSQTPKSARLTALAQSFPEQIHPNFQVFSANAELQHRLHIAFPHKFPRHNLPHIAHAAALWQAFQNNDKEALTPLISTLPDYGLPTSTALFLALKSRDQELTHQILQIAKNVPQPILQLRTGASTLTAEEFTSLRQQQDWIGYEFPDFTHIVTELEAERHELIASLTLPEDPAEEQITAFITHLLSLQALQLLGHEKLAAVALSAAEKLSLLPAHAPSAIHIAAAAQRLGAAEAAILRIRATAFTTLEDFEAAHQTWINLITYQPEATHHASDYSEAAHTAFENANPDQAMEILNTGLFRFPNDLPFALRAGWISILTDQPEEALRYLEHATRLGLPPNEVEHTTALLAIAHTQLGDPDQAHAYLEQLIAIDPSWQDPETIESLPWPEPLKAPLRQLIWQP